MGGPWALQERQADDVPSYRGPSVRRWQHQRPFIVDPRGEGVAARGRTTNMIVSTMLAINM